jgi:hypothetical protein
MKVWIRSSRGPDAPGGLVVEARIELELDDSLLPDGAEEIGERTAAAAAALTLAVNRQFPGPPPRDREIVQEIERESFESARPSVAHSPPFNEFDDELPPRPAAEPAIPPRPGRPDNHRSTDFGGKPPRTGKQLLGWLKDKPELKTRAEKIGKAWDIGSFILKWSDEDAVSIYNELVKKQSANGLLHSNGRA